MTKAEEIAYKIWSEGHNWSDAAIKTYEAGYEQAEKDIWGRIEKYLSEQAPGNYATVGFILKNFEYFKQQIMGEDNETQHNF